MVRAHAGGHPSFATAKRARGAASIGAPSQLEVSSTNFLATLCADCHTAACSRAGCWSDGCANNAAAPVENAAHGRPTPVHQQRAQPARDRLVGREDGGHNVAADDDIDQNKRAEAAPPAVGEPSVTPAPQRRRLVMCCDGTWNDPDAVSDGLPVPTNVAKVALGVSRYDDGGTPQLLYYQAGVGTRRFERFRGGLFGYGISRNVRACYRFVVDTYQPGDELYFFGFSRGAYTARSTVGLIRNCGILRPDHRDRLDEAYRLYKSRDPDKAPREIAAELFRRSYSYDDITIHFIGVWDTVGALGIPIPVPPLIKRHWAFHDTKLSKHVLSAHQALAIDEERRPFKPALWKQTQTREGQTLEQVWFAGGHRDVGGGNNDCSLSEIPLLWLVKRARARGLAFRSDHFVEKDRAIDATGLARAKGAWVDRNHLGPIHRFTKRWYVLLGLRRRRAIPTTGIGRSTGRARRQQPSHDSTTTPRISRPIS